MSRFQVLVLGGSLRPLLHKLFGQLGVAMGLGLSNRPCSTGDIEHRRWRAEGCRREQAVCLVIQPGPRTFLPCRRGNFLMGCGNQFTSGFE